MRIQYETVPSTLGLCLFDPIDFTAIIFRSGGCLVVLPEGETLAAFVCKKEKESDTVVVVSGWFELTSNIECDSLGSEAISELDRSASARKKIPVALSIGTYFR